MKGRFCKDVRTYSRNNNCPYPDPLPKFRSTFTKSLSSLVKSFLFANIVKAAGRCILLQESARWVQGANVLHNKFTEIKFVSFGSIDIL